jgi:hypothetical protein
LRQTNKAFELAPGSRPDFVSSIWEIRFRYELSWLIFQQFFHYLPGETPLKVVADWSRAWLSKEPLDGPVTALNAILTATPDTTAKPVRRYDDMVKQAFYRLQRFRAVPSIAEDQAQAWKDLEDTPITPVCFSCWAQNAPHTKTCVSCGGVLL